MSAAEAGMQIFLRETLSVTFPTHGKPRSMTARVILTYDSTWPWWRHLAALVGLMLLGDEQ